jgi:N-acetylmuramoyl-L-alanine amidase
MTHPYEASLIHNHLYQTAVASAIVEGAEKYRFAVSRNLEGAKDK